MLKTLATIPLIVITLTAPALIGMAHEAQTKASCDQASVTIAFDAETTCDLTPPQQLDLVYPADGTYSDEWTQHCYQAGGTPAITPTRTCIDVDY